MASNLEAVMREFADTMAGGKAKLSTQVVNEKLGEVIVTLNPHNQSAARIVVHGAVGDGVDLALGENTLLEIDSEWNKDEGGWIGELKEICEAVMAGHFSEELWKDGDRIVKSHGRLTIKGKEHIIKRRDFFINPLKTKRRVIINYAPY